MKRETCTDEYIHRQQEYTLFIDIKHTTCSGFCAKLSTTRSRRHWSTSFDKDGTSPVGYEPKNDKLRNEAVKYTLYDGSVRQEVAHR